MRKGHRTFGLHHDTAMVFRFNVRFGSKADMTRRQRDVRFIPKKRTFTGALGMSAKGQQQSFSHSFDHGTTVEGTISVTIRLTLRQ